MDVTFTDLRVARAYSNIRGNGHYDLVSHAFQFNLTGSDFELADLGWLQRSKIRVGGKLDFSAQTSGTPTSPQLNADLHLHDVTLNDEILGDLRLRAESRGLNLRLDGQSNFKNSELFLNANVLLKDQWPAKADFRFSHLDIDSFLASYLHGHVTGHSAVAGNLQLRGPVLNPQQMSITGNLTDFTAELEKIKLHNEGPVLFSLNDRTARIDTFHIAGDNTDFSGGGLVQLAGEKTLDLQAQGKLDLKLIQMYDPDFSASGIIIGSGTATGTLDAPVIKGKLQIGNGAISNVNLPTALSEINGTFAFNQNQVTIETLTGKTGGGTVAFTGHAEFAANQLNFDLTASANAVRLRYPPGVSSTADAELHWNGSARDSVLSGDITVIKVGVTPGFDFATYLQRSAQTSSLPQTNPTLNRIRLDLHVLTAPELQMQTSVIRLQGDADLRVRGNAAKPVLLGRADVLEGEAYFNGTKYRLERGGVTFNNPAVTTPFVDLEATTRVRDYEITLALAGDASQPNGLKVNYRSEPPLPPADIIALLAFGQTTEQSAQLQQTNQSAFSQQASSAMLAAALNATLNNRTQRLFGVSRIKIDPQGLATETSPTQNGPAVTIEQQVKDNLTITYTTDVAQTSQQVIQAEYNISKNVSIVAIRDQNGVVSFDVKIRRRKR
jgi:translocation and assembly module TamB